MSRDFFNQIYRKLFGGEGAAPAAAPFVSERLLRSASFAERHTRWKTSADARKQLDALYAAWVDLEQLHTSHPYMVRYRSAQANGLAIYAGFGFAPETYNHLLDLFLERVLELGYRRTNADRRHRDRGDKVERTDRYYLKPVLGDVATPPLDQRYGNITLELVAHNDKPFLLKVMAAVYSDRMYVDALPFPPLAEALLRRP
jgi:hypothetical protein